MPLLLRTLILALAFCGLANGAPAPGKDTAKDKPAPQSKEPSPAPIRLGEINSYKEEPALLNGYRHGWELARDQINDAGGVMGRPLEVLSRDDGASKDEALKQAAELSGTEQVAALFGSMNSDIALALASDAASRRLPYLVTSAASDRLIWQDGNRYTFRVAPSTRMLLAAVAPRALALRKKRWAIVYPAGPHGEEVNQTFTSMLKAFQSHTEVISSIAVEKGQFTAEMQAVLNEARPEAVLVALQGNDLERFAQLNTATPERPVVVLHSDGAQIGQPWLALGYSADLPASQADFNTAYRARYQQAPSLAALHGYIAVQTLAEALRIAQSTDAEKLTDALEGLRLATPIGAIEYRKLDHQSTLGAHVGTLQDGVLQNVQYIPGERVQLPDTLARRMRNGDRAAAKAAAAKTGDQAADKAAARPDAQPPAAEASPFGAGAFTPAGTALSAWPD